MNEITPLTVPAATRDTHRGCGARSALTARRLGTDGSLGLDRVFAQPTEEPPDRPAPSRLDRVTWPLVLVVGTLACGRHDATPVAQDPAGAVRRYDSAGVARVHNTLSPSGDRRLQLEEAVRIGTVEGDERQMFSRIAGVGISRSGAIVVGNGATCSIRIFGSDGRFLRQFGRAGEGPAELASLNWIWVTGDTVVTSGVLDEKTVISTVNGELVTSARTLQFDPRAPHVLGRGPNGWLGVATKAERRDVEALPSSVAHFVVSFGPAINRRGRDLYSLTPSRPNDNPLGPEPAFGFDERGRSIESAGLPYQIDIRDSNGRIVTRVTKEVAPAPITAAMAARVKSRMIALLDSVGGGRYPDGPKRDLYLRMADERSALPYPLTAPPAGAILVSPDGSFWINRVDDDPVELAATRLAMQRRVSRRWDLFGSDGTFLGYVELPRRFRPDAVQGNQVAGVLRDDLDVEYAVVLRAKLDANALGAAN